MSIILSDPFDVDDIDSAIERWQAAGRRFTVSRAIGRKKRRDAVAAFRRVNMALGAERGFPAELEDFEHEPLLTQGDEALAYVVALYGVPLGRVVCKAGGLRGWIFYPSAPVAELTNERVVVGARPPARRAGATAWVLREPQQIAEALNDAATLCLARLS